jgi:serine/threonine protein kinase
MILESVTEESASPIPPPRYETIAPIGRGGMAEVFLAVTVGAGGIPKLAVLKRIWPELANDQHFLAMFLDEARLSVRMAHPNLVQTYEIIEQDDGLAIAMEYLDGQPLGRVLNRLVGAQALSLPQRVRIVTKLLAALDYVHELTDYDGTPLSVVHRDVSPHNVFVTYDGSVKLVDFGVAKSVAGAHQTRPGTLKGKFSYMAPEQFKGQVADRRSDLFSVGVILWEMLARRRFWGGVADNHIAAHLISDRSLPALPAELGLPVEFEAICARALARDREGRYATAAEMEADLEQVLTTNHEASDRLLGKVVAEGFTAERAERQLLIDRHLRKIRSGSYPLRSGSYPAVASGYPTPSASLPPMVIPTAAVPARVPWVAVALVLAAPVLLLVSILSGRGGIDQSAPRMIEAHSRAAVVGQPGPSAPPASGRAEAIVMAPAGSFATGHQDSTGRKGSAQAEGERARGAELARRDRRSTASPPRGAAPAMTVAPTPSSVAPASHADFGADQQRASPEPRPIDTTNPFHQGALPQPRPIDTTNPFLPKASPPTNGEPAQPAR